MPPILLFSALPLIIVLLTILARKYRNYRRLTKSLEKLPTAIKPSAIVGHLIYLRKVKDEKDFLTAVKDGIMGMAQLTINEGMYLSWILHKPFVVLHSAENVKALLSSRSNLTKGPEYNPLLPWLKQGLLTSTGEKWKSRRKLLTPTFHYKILDEFQTVFDSGSQTLVQKLNAFTEKDFADIVPLVISCTLSIICETAMGIKLDSRHKDSLDYGNALNRIGTIFLKRNVNPLLLNDMVFLLSKYHAEWEEVLSTLHSFTRKILNDRKQQMMEDLEEIKIHGVSSTSNENGVKKRQAFLDLLLQEQLMNNSLTDDDICEEVDTFAFEGHDTTAMGICWTLYHLGRHPQAQEKVYEDIQEVLGNDNRSVTPEDLKKMIYLECVVKESLRLRPSVPLITRTLTEDLVVGKYNVPKGVTVVVDKHALHLNPKVFPNPEVFDPDRFLPEASIGRHPFAYIPFSAGPRNCIGQKFAMMELKTAVAHVIRDFVIEAIDPPDKVRYSVAMILRPIDGLRLKIRKRT